MNRYDEFNTKTQTCPYCGLALEGDGVGGWRCDDCDLDYDTVYDHGLGKYVLQLFIPDICIECDGPYPDCRSSCGIWDQ